MTKALSLVLLVPVGCANAADLEGPAPEGALECSLAYTIDAGYQLVDGGVDEGFLRVVQRIAPEPSEARPTRPEPDLADVAVVEPAEIVAENELLIEEDGGRLRISILGVAQVEAGGLEGSTARDQGMTILAMCTSAPPVFPGIEDPPTTPLPPGAPL